MTWWRGLDLNQRPLGYEPSELTRLLHPATNYKCNVVAPTGLEPVTSGL